MVISFSLDSGNKLFGEGKLFASMNGGRLVLNFGRDSFLWDTDQSVDLEGELER